MEERLELGFDALEKALERVAEAGVYDRFAPLAESLLWLVMINDAFWEDNQETYAAMRHTDARGQVFEGLRYARHRLVHDIRVYGMHGVIHLGGAFNEGFSKGFEIGTPQWTWRDISKLDKAKDDTGEDVYLKHLQGKEVESSLHDASSFLRDYRKEWVPTIAEE